MERFKYKDMDIVEIQHASGGCDDFCSLDESDFEKFYSVGARKLYYWYSLGSYEGDGTALFYAKGKWHIEVLSHCSCFGPCEIFEFDPSGAEDNPEDFCSRYKEADSYSDIAELVKIAREDMGKQASSGV